MTRARIGPRGIATIDRLAARLRFNAVALPLYDGTVPDVVRSAMVKMTPVNPHLPAIIACCTRDVGHHACGWWKNPDYERCTHLSISYRNRDGSFADQDRATSNKLCQLVFGDDASLLWAEPPFSEDGKRRDVWHYRVFADQGWLTQVST